MEELKCLKCTEPIPDFVEEHLRQALDPEWQRVHRELTGMDSPIFDLYVLTGAYDDEEAVW